MKFPDFSELGSVDIEGAGRFRIYMVRDGVGFVGTLNLERLTDALSVLPQTDWDPCMAASVGEVAEAIARKYADLDDEPRPCPVCGSTETVEIHDERQSVLVCAECGSDEP